MTCKKAQNVAKTLDFELSAPIFYRGIKELVEKKIIAKSVDKIVFYINPAVFFNGDRARFVTEVIKKKEEIEKKNSKKISPHSAITYGKRCIRTI